jgi:predicted PurR-regulated permease PerM
MEEKSPINLNKLVKNILTICTIAFILFLLWYFMSITIYILVGVILSLIARPLYIQLEKISIGKFKIPGAINALVSIFLIWGILGGIGAIVFPIMVKEVVKISKVNPERFISQLEKPINSTIKEMETLGLISFNDKDSVPVEHTKTIERIIVYKLPCDSIYNAVYNKGSIFEPEVDTLIKASKNVPDEEVKDTVVHGIVHRKEIDGMIRDFGHKYVNMHSLGVWFGSAFNIVGNILATIVSASFLAFFFLRDKSLFKNIIIAILPQKYEKKTIIIMGESRKILSRYFIGLILELILVMALTTIGLLIIGLNFQISITIGFFAGLFNVVPYIGPLIGGVIGLCMGVSNYLEADVYLVILPLIGKMALVFAIVQIIDNNIFQTVIFSNSVKAHPIEIFLVIVIAGSLGGIGAMIFAVPVYSVLRIIGKQFFSHFKFIRSLTQNI